MRIPGIVIAGAGTGRPIRLLVGAPVEVDMQDGPRPPFPASEPERASIRALKNWLLAMPGESAFEDQLNRLRVADAIARVSAGPDHPGHRVEPKAARRRGD